MFLLGCLEKLWGVRVFLRAAILNGFPAMVFFLNQYKRSQYGWPCKQLAYIVPMVNIFLP